MKSEFSINIVLDKRYKKTDGTYPVKLWVYCTATKKAYRYPTEFSLSKEDFASTWETVKPREANKATRHKLDALKTKALTEAALIKPFNITMFEKRLFRKTGAGVNVFHHYTEVIAELKHNEQIGNASNYQLSQRSLKAYIANLTGCDADTVTKLNFIDITPQWLTGYENYMLSLGKSRTTVSMYVSALRSVFNRAIKAKDIPGDLYPFGKDNYKLPSVKRVKKALNKQELKKLFEAVPATPEQEKAKSFWFFSYTCNGMNIKDIALLRSENYTGETLKFFRAKTINSSKENLTEVVVYLTDFAKGVIEKYGVPGRGAKDFIFPILDAKDNADTRHAKTQNFTRFINQNFKKIAEAVGITGDISTYYARHSFATNAIRSGASIELVSEALSHSNIKTTKGYFAGFEDETKKELTNKLLNFEL